MTQSGFVGSLSFYCYLDLAPGLPRPGCCLSFITGGAFQRARAFSKLEEIGHFLLVVVIWTKEEFYLQRLLPVFFVFLIWGWGLGAYL